MRSAFSGSKPFLRRVHEHSACAWHPLQASTLKPCLAAAGCCVWWAWGFPIMRGTGLFNTRIGLLPKQARQKCLAGVRAAVCLHLAHSLRDGIAALTA